MNAKIKKRWVKALRSGEYKQGQASLRQESDDREKTYCCLGVLCDILDPSLWAEVVGNRLHQWSDEVTHGYLPQKAQELSGLGDDNPIVNFDGTYKRLGYLNDHGETFEKIADAIEASL